jgi:hypothetical protein
MTWRAVENLRRGSGAKVAQAKGSAGFSLQAVAEPRPCFPLRATPAISVGGSRHAGRAAGLPQTEASQ